MSASQQAEALRRLESWLENEHSRCERESVPCRYVWNEQGDLLRITESDGSESTYTYDDLRRLEAVRHPDGAWTHYRYGSNDRLLEIDAPGGRTHFEYDSAGRLAVMHRGDAGGVVYRYDEQGRVVEYRTAFVSTRQFFDPCGRVAALCQTLDGVAIWMRFAYDSVGRLSELSLPGGTLHYQWDVRGRPARVSFAGTEVARFEYDDANRICRMTLANGVVEETAADGIDGRPLTRCWTRNGEMLERRQYTYDAVGKLLSDGECEYRYDALGRLAAAWCVGREPAWNYHYDARDNRIDDLVQDVTREYRFDAAGQLLEVRTRGETAIHFTYDAKGRLVATESVDGIERYFYGPADELFAVTDGTGRPLRQYVRTPFGCVAEIDRGELHFLHLDERGTSRFVTDASGALLSRHHCDPWGLPLVESPGVAPWFGGRIWNPAARLYNFGSRWYDPALGRFLTPDTYTAAPDDVRVVHALGSSRAQAQVREQLLPIWLRRPRCRNRFAFCGNDPVNCVDPNGHWAFGRVLLPLLGAIWTLPNTLFGLLVEITCLMGEVIRWIVYEITAGKVNWATPGFDLASSERLNASALVFSGGWIGSFAHLLGITFGNVFFVYDDWENHPWFAEGGDVAPLAYGGRVTFPRHDALYEHELRHTNQYGWLGPFFHLGLPLFGVYEWDVILHGYEDSWLETDARRYGGS